MFVDSSIPGQQVLENISNDSGMFDGIVFGHLSSDRLHNGELNSGIDPQDSSSMKGSGSDMDQCKDFD